MSKNTRTHNISVAIVDDDVAITKLLQRLFAKKYETSIYTNGNEAWEKISANPPDLVLLDIRMPGMDGLELLERIKKSYPELPVIMITASKDVESAIQAMKLGASEYITKPFDLDELEILVDKALQEKRMKAELERLKKEVEGKYSFENIIGKSKAMEKVFSLMERAINTDVTVLIEGESGTGKELIARALHYNGPRKNGPFVAVDCGAIPESLIEAELFGYEKGAFTGAYRRKPGYFELANGGTLFLDEISNLSMDMQAKFLRALQEKKITRVGGTEPIDVDVRIIAATNKRLEELVSKGLFREDLFFRLNVFKITLPLLKERKEDIPLLVEHFIKIYNKEFAKSIKGVTPEVMDIFMKYDWPGNVRELENTIQRAVIMATEDYITKDYVQDIAEKIENKFHTITEKDMSLEELEKEYIASLLKKYNGNISKTASILGITRKTLYNKIEKYRLKELLRKTQ